MKRHHKGHKTDPVKKDTQANAAESRFKFFERNIEFDNVRLNMRLYNLTLENKSEYLSEILLWTEVY